MTEHILDTIEQGARVVLYPSSCGYHAEFQDAPFDVVILNSHRFRRSRRRGKVYCLGYDNNELLGLLLARGIKLSAIIIIRDGCAEGGNYECVVKEGFFGRLMPIMAEGFKYICDHNHENIPFDAPAHFDPIAVPDYVEPFVQFSEPIDAIQAFQVTLFPTVERDFVLGKIRVRVIRDSIWRNYQTSGLTVIIKRDESAEIAVPNYLGGLLPNVNVEERFKFVQSYFKMGTLEPLLHRANQQKLKVLSLMPTEWGKYEKLADEILRWKKEYPQEVCFYHLHSDDYQYLKSLQIG